MKREHMVKALAPVAPPCFRSRDQWIEYAIAAAAEQRLEHEPGPLVFTRDDQRSHGPDAGPYRLGWRQGGVDLDTDAGLKTAAVGLNVQPVLIFKNRRVSFNAQLDFCSECTTAYRSQMTREKRCNPNHLRELSLEPA